MQRLFLGLAVLRNAPAGIALIMAAVLAAVALTFVAANMTTAGPTPTYPVVVDPGDETGAIDLATLTYDEAKTLLLPILDGTEIKLLFPAEPGLGQVEMSGTTISFDDTDGVITFNGSSTLLALVLATKFKTSFTATWGTDPTPELVLDSVAKSDISTSDLLTLLPIAVPSGLPELTLSNASLSVVTSPVPAISVFADATFLSVSTSVLYSTADRDNDSGTASEFLFGINASSFALSAFGVTLPFSSPDLPVSMTLANAEQTLSSSELTAPELTFFTIFYGSEPFDVGVDTGLNFATRLPFSALPNPIIKELGLTPADTVLLEGSVEVNTSFELVALSLKASMPSEVSLPGVPGWISLTGDGLSLELGYDSSEGASEISLAVAGDFEADLNGDVLGFHLGLQLKSGDTSSVEVTGNTTTPWVHPFEIPWLTLDEISLTLTAEGSELGALLDSTFTIGSGPAAKSFQIVLEVTGDPGSLAATVTATSLDPLTTNDIIDLLASIVEVDPPVGLPELALENLTISIETGEATALSISADITFLGVEGSVLFSVTDRDNNITTPPEFLFGVNIPSFQLQTLADSVGISLPEPLASEKIPEVAFVISGTPGSISSGNLTLPERNFFSGAFGSLPDSDFTIKLQPGLNLAGEIPLSAIPEPILTALGVSSPDPEDVILLEGAIELELGIGTSPSIELVSLDLKAVFPPGLGLPGLPGWIVLAGDGLSLELGYHSSEEASEISLAVAGDFEADLNGDVLGFHLGLQLKSGDTLSVEVTGNTTTPWVHPFEIPWLTLDEISLTLTAEGSDLGALIESSFIVGSTTFELSIEVTGSPGNLEATVSASVDSLDSNDLLALLAEAGIDTAGLTVPKVILTDVEVSISAGTSGVGFSAGGNISLEIVDGLELEAQLLVSFAASASGPQLILGIQATDVSLCDLILPLNGTLVCDFEIQSLVLVVSVGDGGEFESSQLSPPVKSFYEQVYGTDEFTLDLIPGVNLIAAIPLPDGGIKDGLSALGVEADQPLLITGTLPIPGLGGSSLEIHLAATLPQITLPPITPQPLVAVESGQLSFHIDVSAAPPNVSIGVTGTLNLIVDEVGAPDTVLVFTVSGDFGGPPITLSLSGSLEAEDPAGWVAPFGLEWLTLHQLGIFFSLEVGAPPTPVTFGIQLSAEADIAEKNMSLVIGLEVTVVLVPTPAAGAPVPVPVVTNFAFEGTSTSNWGTTDLVGLAELVAGQPGSIPPGTIPNVELRPVSDTKPITAKFVLLDSPPSAPVQLTAGFGMSGVIFADLTPLDGGALDLIAEVDIDISLDGLFIFGSIPQDIVIGPVTLSDPLIDIEVVFIPPSASFIFTGTLTTPWGTQVIEVNLNTDGLAADLLAAFDELNTIVTEWGGAIETAAEDALVALQALLDPPPPWLTELAEFVEQARIAFPAIDNVADIALGGIDVAIPPGQGLPNGGVEPDGCPLLQPLRSGDRCYALLGLPDKDGIPDGGVAKVCRLDVPFESGGRCYIIGPDKNGFPDGGVAADNCPVLQPSTSGGRCYAIVPFGGTPSGGVAPVCSIFTPHLVSGRCYSRTPGSSFQHWHHWLVFHKHIDADGSPNGGTSTICPVLQPFRSGSRCYTVPPISGFPSGGVAKNACPVLDPFKVSGRCYTIPPNNGVPSGGLAKDACPIIQPFESGGRCYFVVPNNGTPTGGVDVACDIFHAFPSGGRCYTFPPTDATHLFHLPGLCEIFTFIECSLEELLMGTVFDIKSDEADEILGSLLVEPLDNTRPTANAGGPYKVGEGGSIMLTAVGSTDPDDDPLKYAWDFDLDGTTDASGEVAKFSAIGLDGPGVVNVALTVSDGEFSDTTTVQVTINNVDPTVAISGAAKVFEGTAYKLALTVSDPGVEAPVGWNIDWGDGVAESLPGNATSASHIYAGDVATPTISAEFVDEDGAYQANALQISVNNVAPEVSADGQKVDEASEATISGTINDAGSGDGFNVVIEWGDGASTKLALPPGSSIYSATHTYADDSPSGTSSDVYAVSVAVTDDDGATGTAETSVKVNNVAPTLTAEGGKIPENGTAKVSGTISDPSDLDSFIVTIDWGEGTPTVLNLPAGTTAYSAEHQYLDDNPTGTQADVYNIGVSIIDDDGGANTTVTAVTVNNVAPELAASSIASDTEALSLSHPAKVDEGESFKLSASFKDPGTLDDFSVLVEWGDDSFSELDIAAGEPLEFSFSHLYLDDNPTGTPSDQYQITVQVLDDDGGAANVNSPITVNNLPPDVNAGADVKVDEGENFIQIGVHDGDGSYMDPGVDTTTATVNYGDGTGVQPLPLHDDMSFDLNHVYADNGNYTVTVEVTDDDAGVGTDILIVTVNNVAPTVNAGADQKSNEADIVSLSPATFNDKGTLDTHTATIDWGDGTPADVGVVTEAPFGPPGSTAGADGTVSGSHIYGDDGEYTVSVCVQDDDGGTGCDTFLVSVNNVDPMAEIDLSDAILINGVPTLLAHAGDPVDFNGRSTDPGSDDLTLIWDWDDSSLTSTIYLVNPPDPDPFPSPNVQPRDVKDVLAHTFANACLYEVQFWAEDDDGGQSPVDTVNIIIVGNAEEVRSAGFWQNQFRRHLTGRGRAQFEGPELECYLDIVGYMSQVFDEERDASTFASAQDVLLVNRTADMSELLDRQLLAVWLNFANGSIEYDELLDTDGDGIPETAFADAVAAAEAVRLDPGATRAELDQQKDFLEGLNLGTG